MAGPGVRGEPEPGRVVVDDDPRIDDLEAGLGIDVISITRDQDGLIAIDGGGLSVECVVFILRCAEGIVIDQHFYPDDDEPDD